jgi:hypothetical protein
MQADALATLYTKLADAIAHVGDDRTSLLLATLALDLIASQDDVVAVTEAIARAERLASV